MRETAVKICHLMMEASIMVIFVAFALALSIIIILRFFWKKQALEEEIMIRYTTYTISFSVFFFLLIYNISIAIDTLKFGACYLFQPVFGVFGWYFCTYTYSFFTLVLFTLHLSGAIASLTKQHIIAFYPVIFLIFATIHCFQYYFEFYYDGNIVKYRKNAKEDIFCFYIYVGFCIALYDIAFLGYCYYDEKVLLFYSLIMILFLVIVLIIFIKKYRQLIFMVGIFPTPIMFAMIWKMNIFHIIDIMYYILLLTFVLIDLSDSNNLKKDQFYYNDDLYLKKSETEASLIMKSNSNRNIVQIAIYKRHKLNVTEYSDKCLHNYQIGTLMLEGHSIDKFTVTEENRCIKYLVINSLELPKINDLKQYFPNLASIQVKDENSKLKSINNQQIYKIKSRSLIFVNKDVKKLVVREFTEFIESRACWNCRQLKYVSIPSSLKAIDKNAFDGCTSMKVVVMRSIKLNIIGEEAFKSCFISTIIFPSSIKIIGNSAFQNCHYLKNIKFQEPSELEIIGSRAFIFTSIKSVDFPLNLKSIGQSAFSHITDLSSITFKEGSNIEIGQESFSSTNIKRIIIPSSFREIKESSFKNVSTLKYVEFSRITKIGDFSFFGTSIESVTIPSSVSSIGKKAFASNAFLDRVEFIEGSQLIFCDKTAFNKCYHLKKIFYSDEDIVDKLPFQILYHR